MPAETLTAAGQDQLSFWSATGCRAWPQTLFDKERSFVGIICTPS
jgi:hypothetical protein